MSYSPQRDSVYTARQLRVSRTGFSVVAARGVLDSGNTQGEAEKNINLII